MRGVALGEEEQAREEPPRVAAPHAPRPVRARARRELAPRARGAVAVWEGHDARVQGVAKGRRGRGGAREGEQGSRDGALGEREALEARLEASSGSEHRAHEFRRERATREVVPSERVGGRLIGRGARRRAPRAARTTHANRVEAGAAAPRARRDARGARGPDDGRAERRRHRDAARDASASSRPDVSFATSARVTA